jgi:DNA invertase Pin-like site-specific DNA recombinase
MDIYAGMRSEEHGDRIKASLKARRKKGYRLGPPIKATPIDIDMIIKLRIAKHSIAYIAKQVGLSVGLTHMLIHIFKDYILLRQPHTLNDLHYG